MLPSLNILLFIKNKKKKLPYYPYKEKKILRLCGCAIGEFLQNTRSTIRPFDHSTFVLTVVKKNSKSVNKCEKKSARGIYSRHPAGWSSVVM